jgi:hypothetical protein
MPASAPPPPSNLDATRQTITIQTDLNGVLMNEKAANDDASSALNAQLARFPTGCRAAIMLITGKAPDITTGVDLARTIPELLWDVRPEMFTEDPELEFFALPNQPPYGEVTIDIFFFAGCEPTE